MRYRVIAPDLRGSCWTDVPPQGYKGEHILADVLELLDKLGLRRAGLLAITSASLFRYKLCFDHADLVAGFLCLGAASLSACEAADASPVCSNCGSSRSSQLRGWGNGLCALPGSLATR